jgi:hypothetical protein
MRAYPSLALIANAARYGLIFLRTTSSSLSRERHGALSMAAKATFLRASAKTPYAETRKTIAQRFRLEPMI